MIVTKRKRLVIRMGEYESQELIAEVQYDTETDQRFLGESPTTAEIALAVDAALDELLFADVEDASYQTADPDSFIHQHHADLNKRSKHA